MMKLMRLGDRYGKKTPCLVAADALHDVQALDMWLDVNDRRVQTGSTSKMIFDVATIVSHTSEFCQLEPGDLICTGTPRVSAPV